MRMLHYQHEGESLSSPQGQVSDHHRTAAAEVEAFSLHRCIHGILWLYDIQITWQLVYYAGIPPCKSNCTDSSNMPIPNAQALPSTTVP